jgi:tetratricopeptide (TPR) repeat protein
MKFILLILIFASCANQEKSVNTKKAELYYSDGTSNLLNKNYTRALESLLQAYNLDPENTEINNNLGMAYYFKKSKTNAIKHLKKAIELDEKNTDAIVNLASIYMDGNKLKEAEGLYKKALDNLIYDKQQRTYYNLGILEIRRNNKKSALNYFTKSIEVDDNYCPAHYQIGVLAFDKNNFNLALKEFKDAANGVCVNNPEPHYYQALSYISLNKKDQAQIKLEEIMERFAQTKYFSMAQMKLDEIKSAKTDSNTLDASVLKYKYRKISTPNF